MTSPTFNPVAWKLDDDVQSTCQRMPHVLQSLRGARIFLTGGTGFIGTWLLEVLRRAEQAFSLGLRVSVMVRNPASMRTKAPHLADFEAFQFLQGDVLSPHIPRGDYTHLIHGATDASADLNERDPLKMFDTVVNGTRWALEFARINAVPRTLLMSSGAVYGQQPWDMECVSEAWMGGPSCANPKAAYAEGKRAAEMLTAIYAKQHGVNAVTARIFALLGPYLSLDIHFAAGNFIRDALAGRPIVVQGDGRPCRSYLYATDLAGWLLTMLTQAAPGATYNVGSDIPVSIRELAETTRRLLGGPEVQILGAADSGWNPGRYVPDTRLIRAELGVSQTVSLADAICRTAAWHGWRGKA